MRVYTPLEQAGRDIYIREGCYVCHSQMIRTPARRGRALRALFAGGRVEVRPSDALGLEAHRARIWRGSASKYSDALAGARTWSTRATWCRVSVMPQYAFLLDDAARDRRACRGASRRCGDVGVPYTDDMIANARRRRARPGAARTATPPTGVVARYGEATTVRAFDGRTDRLTEMDALVAYLQILGGLTDLREAAEAMRGGVRHEHLARLDRRLLQVLRAVLPDRAARSGSRSMPSGPRSGRASTRPPRACWTTRTAHVGKGTRPADRSPDDRPRVERHHRAQHPGAAGGLVAIGVTHVWALVVWILMPAWPLLWTYTRGILGIDQKERGRGADRRGATSRAPTGRTAIAAMPSDEIRADPALMARGGPDGAGALRRQLRRLPRAERAPAARGSRASSTTTGSGAATRTRSSRPSASGSTPPTPRRASRRCWPSAATAS